MPGDWRASMWRGWMRDGQRGKLATQPTMGLCRCKCMAHSPFVAFVSQLLPPCQMVSPAQQSNSYTNILIIMFYLSCWILLIPQIWKILDSFIHIPSFVPSFIYDYIVVFIWFLVICCSDLSSTPNYALVVMGLGEQIFDCIQCNYLIPNINIFSSVFLVWTAAWIIIL